MGTERGLNIIYQHSSMLPPPSQVPENREVLGSAHQQYHQEEGGKDPQKGEGFLGLLGR